MTDRPWLSQYPEGVPADVDTTHYRSLVELMEESFGKYADRTAYSFMGKDVSYADTDAGCHGDTGKYTNTLRYFTRR